MDFNSVLTAVSTLGFPICMCGALFWYMIQQNNQHSEESKGMQEAISELKIAIIELTEKLRKEE